jgi:putative transposase
MSYETNLSDARWAIIADFIEDGRKRKHSLRNVVDAMLYVTKTGCQWRYLPQECFPKWQLVYYYFRKFETTGLIEIIHDEFRERVREKKGKEKCPSLGLVDSQSVKTASITAEKGLDGNKKVNGRKRFLLTDTLGLIIGILVVAANVGERSGAEKLFLAIRGKYPRLEKVLADQGFNGEDYVARIESLFGFIFEIVNKVLGVGGFQVLPKRWIVERTFGWLIWNRRLVKDYEEKVEVSRAFIHLAMIRLMVKQLAP